MEGYHPMFLFIECSWLILSMATAILMFGITMVKSELSTIINIDYHYNAANISNIKGAKSLRDAFGLVDFPLLQAQVGDLQSPSGATKLGRGPGAGWRRGSNQ